VANTLVSVDEDGLAPKHRQNVALRTYHGTRRAADAICGVDMRMLRLRTVRPQASFLRGLAGESLLSRLFLEISPDEQERHGQSDQQADEVIHSFIFS
jgi:hypothetical protein